MRSFILRLKSAWQHHEFQVYVFESSTLKKVCSGGGHIGFPCIQNGLLFEPQ